MEKLPAVFILDSNDKSRELLEVYLNELKFAEIHSLEVNSEAYNLIQNNLNSIVIVDIGDNDANVDSFLEKIRLLECKIIAVSIDYSTNNIVKAFRNGAKDFLPKPILKKDLKKALTTLLNDEEKVSNMLIDEFRNGSLGRITLERP